MLASHTEEKRLFRKQADSHTLYEGKIFDNRFTLNPIHVPQDPEDTNSMLPLIIGSVAAADSGSVIHIKMRTRNFVTVFLLIWSVAFVTFGLHFALHGQIDSTLEQLAKMILAIVVPPGLLYFFIHSFHTQAKEQQDLLLGIFQNPHQHSNSNSN